MTPPSQPLRLAVAGALCVGGGVGVGRFVFTPILPIMAQAQHLSTSQAGLIASANFGGYLLGALIASVPVFAQRPRFWLQGALAISALTTAAMGLSASVPVFLLLRGLGGLASAFVLVFASTVVLPRLAQANRSSLSAVHFAGVGCAIVASAALVAGMVLAGFDWRSLWIGSGVLTGLAAIFVWRLLPPDPSPMSPGGDKATMTAAGGGSSLMLAYGLFGFGYVVTATFIVAIVRTYPAARPVEPFIWMVVGASAIPSVALWTAVGGRIGMRRAFSAACVVEALGVGISVLLPTAWGALAASLLLGGTYMGITAVGLVAARETRPDDVSGVLGRMTAAFGLGQMIGPAFAGWLAERSGGFSLPSLIASGTLLIAAALTARRLEP